MYLTWLKRYLHAVAPLEFALKRFIFSPVTSAASADAVIMSKLQGLAWQTRLAKSCWLVEDIRHVKQLPELETEPTRFRIESSDPYRRLDTLLPTGLLLPTRHNTSVALGWLAGLAYPLEGMTLGSQQLFPLVSEALGFDFHFGARFFSGYGSETSTSWKTFRTWLSDLPADVDIAIEMAIRAFEWFEFSLRGNATFDVESLLIDSTWNIAIDSTGELPCEFDTALRDGSVNDSGFDASPNSVHAQFSPAEITGETNHD